MSLNGANLVLTNVHSRPIFSFAIGSERAAVTDWYPCLDPSVCDNLQPGQSRTIVLTDSYFDGETEAIVYWWQSVRDSDGTYHMDGFHSHVVPINR
jgi:hypothetical protein